MNTWPRLSVLLGAAAMVLAGCGGTGSNAEESETPTLQVADTAGTPLYFLTYGDRRGFFQQSGVNVELTSSTGGATVIPELVSGDLDVAGSNVASAIIAASEGLPVKMVAAGTSTSQNADDDFSSLMAPADSPVESIADLKGKKIAVNSLRNINDVVLGSMLEEAGLEHNAARFVEIPFPDMAAAVQRGDVAAAMIIEPFATIAEEEGLRTIGRPYTDLRPGLQIGTYLMTEQAVAENPQAVEAFQKGVQKTADAIAQNPEAFRNALPKIGDIDPQLAQEAGISVWRGKNDLGSLELVQDLLAKYGLINQRVNLEQVAVD